MISLRWPFEGAPPCSRGSRAREPLELASRAETCMLFADFIADLASAWERSQDTFWPQTLVFLSLVLRVLGLALLVGIPAGLILARLPRIAAPIIAVLAVLQAVPSLVLLALLLPVLGIGQTP